MKLVTVQGRMQLAAPAAAGWLALVDHSRREYARTPLITSPAGAWRSEELVEDMFRNPSKYGASQGVARPKSLGGPGSVHENGLCVDINNWRAYGGLVLHKGFWRSSALDGLCAAHGFHPDPRYPNEPWHYQHNGTVPAGGGRAPFPQIIQLEGLEMDTILVELLDNYGRYGAKNGRYYSLWSPSSGRVQKINDPALADQLVVRFGKVDPASGAPTGSGFNCAYADWESIHGGTYDPRA